MFFSDYLPHYQTVKAVFPNNPICFQNDITHETTNIIKLLEKNVPEFRDGAVSQLHPLLINGHLQTVYASLRKFTDIDNVLYKRLVIHYAHGGEGTLDFVVKSKLPDELQYTPLSQKFLPSHGQYSFISPDDTRLKSTDDKPMLIVLHGLTGGSHESYVRSLVHNITQNYGFEACVLNSRGCCESSITTPMLYNGGWTNDVRYCVKKLRHMYPNRKFYMAGFSLGASVMVNYLGEEGDNSDISSAVSVSVPWDLAKSGFSINESLLGRYIYSPALSKNLLTLTDKHIENLRHNKLFTDYENKSSIIKSIKAFDDAFTGPMFGYEDATTYYNDASPYKRICGIRTPLLAINAVDDPITGSANLPIEEIIKNPYTTLIETDIGGHVAWFMNEYGQRWYVDPICKYFSTFHREIVSKNLKPVVDPSHLPSDPVPNVMTTLPDNDKQSLIE
ncbi:hypothetical protein TPHA_0G00670 [Tetrapisispora phaffii CBS 4417]|uniref:AB hydrolase-1 domain-containing protein n=1 Tax=Tetrapisispora phaffii (strain ATCC 24235 / CBS 4417 / NBRC 1672 / NRRL Y-8282 / UCD 70-5) TaxID=1071381 RepID=G8BVH5_TETPH|nr:hypothetical protein TPHA_0G00670 [Tetrapisispora phaffii CBS 4417]CCE63903.1 hypothetical protein TPHA_0G00670 [Tetrapisispora phaffii CBS 4417]